MPGSTCTHEAGGLGYDRRSMQSCAPDGTGADGAFDPVGQDPGLRTKVRQGVALDQGDFFEGDKPAEADRTRRRGRATVATGWEGASAPLPAVGSSVAPVTAYSPGPTCSPTGSPGRSTTPARCTRS